MLSKNLSNIKRKILGNAKNQTRCCWVRSKFATSALCSLLKHIISRFISAKLDAVVISHTHYDHMDANSIYSLNRRLVVEMNRSEFYHLEFGSC